MQTQNTDINELTQCLDNITLKESHQSPKKKKKNKNKDTQYTPPNKIGHKDAKETEPTIHPTPIAFRTRSKMGHTNNTNNDNNNNYVDSSIECHVCFEETNNTLECGHKVCEHCMHRIKNSIDCLYMCPVCKLRL